MIEEKEFGGIKVSMWEATKTLDQRSYTVFNRDMILTKSDLSAIKKVVKGETEPLRIDLKKDIKKLDKKFDNIDSHLGLNTSEF